MPERKMRSLRKWLQRRPRIEISENPKLEISKKLEDAIANYCEYGGEDPKELRQALREASPEAALSLFRRRDALNLPPYLRSYLERDGTRLAGKPVEYTDGMRRTSALIWEELCKRAQKDGRNPKVVLDDLQATIVNEVLRMKTVLQAGPRSRDSSEWRHRAALALEDFWEVTSLDPEILEMGPGVDETIGRLESWLRETAEQDDIADLVDSFALPEVAVTIAANARFASGRKEARWLAHRAQECLPSSDSTDGEAMARSLYLNPAFSEDGFRGVVDSFIDFLKDNDETDENEPHLARPGTLFKMAREKGWSPDPQQQDFLTRAAEQAEQDLSWAGDRLPGARKWQSYYLVCATPVAAMNDALFERVMERGATDLMVNLAGNSQGQKWLRIAKRLSMAASDQSLAGADPESVARILAEATEWNLEGLTRGDLIPLISSSNAQIRATALELMKRTESAPATEHARTR